MAGYFQANEFSLPTHSISYSSDRRSDEWNRRDEEERERHGGTVCGVTQRGAALCGRSGRREIAEGELKILKHDLCPRVLNLIHRCPMHLITGSKFQTIRSVCFFTLQWKADDGLYPPIKRNTLTRSACVSLAFIRKNLYARTRVAAILSILLSVYRRSRFSSQKVETPRALVKVSFRVRRLRHWLESGINWCEITWFRLKETNETTSVEFYLYLFLNATGNIEIVHPPVKFFVAVDTAYIGFGVIQSIRKKGSGL